MDNKKRIFLFEKAVLCALGEYNMISQGDSVLVCLSGGADSVSLLLSLSSLAKQVGFSIAACHVNHMIRGAEANRDELFSKELCTSLCVPFYSEKINIPQLCKNEKGSLEEIARRERYSYFERLSQKYGFSRIATAHTMSDNAETVLFNLARGTTADGICGIPPVRGKIIRPLIRISRLSVEEYLSLKGQKYVTDSTNNSEDYSRNFIRHSIVPNFKLLNPEFEKALLRLSDSARCDRNYFELLTQEISEKDMNISELHCLAPSILSRYIKASAKRAFGEGFSLPSERVAAVEKAIHDCFSDKKNRSISLPDNKTAYISFHGITYNKSSEKTEKMQTSFNIPLTAGQNILNEVFAVYVANGCEQIPDVIKSEDIIYKMYKKAECLSGIINGSLFARNRKSEDSVRIGGMSRKLKKIFIDLKIPQEERHLVPIICDSCGILCLPLFEKCRDSELCGGGTEKTVFVFYRS